MSRNHWHQAPLWALRLRELQIASLQQQHIIIDLLRALQPASLPPAQQAKLNEAFDTATAIKKKIDDAETPL